MGHPVAINDKLEDCQLDILFFLRMQRSMRATLLSVGAAAGGLAPGEMGGPPVAGKTDWYWSSFDLSSMFSISRSLGGYSVLSRDFTAPISTLFYTRW